MTNTEITISQGEAGDRLDIFLSKKYPDYSRSFLAKLIEKNNVTVNGGFVKPSHKMTAGDTVTINFSKEQKVVLSPEPIRLEILFEDDNVIVINKQPGLVVHPAAGNLDGTLVNALLAHSPMIREAVYDKGNSISKTRPGLVHRLDKDTSGTLIVAKNIATLHFLSDQFKQHLTNKIYWALCSGWPKNPSGQLVNYLGRHPNQRKQMTDIGADRGREAISNYSVLKYFKDKYDDKLSLIEFNIKTGRTHQIRVQAKIAGYPVLGDIVYNNKESIKISKRLGADRQLLHARELTIRISQKDRSESFIAPLPADFEKILSSLNEIN